MRFPTTIQQIQRVRGHTGHLRNYSSVVASHSAHSRHATSVARDTKLFSSSLSPKPKRPLSSTRAEFSSPSPAPSENYVPAIPIDFSASSRIEGEESNVAMVNLTEGQVLRAESGAMIFMTEGIEMDTKLAGASSAFSRLLTGQNVFLTDFRFQGEGQGTVALGTDFPSKIIRLNLEDHPGSSLICQRGAYLASNPTVDIQTEMSHSLTAGFFGGQGFILQKLTGEGDVLIKAGGTLVKKYLEEGEVLRCTSGSVVAFESSCQYNVQMMPGVKNVMFGGEGLFVTTLTGPGRIWLQGMPPDRMISEIARRVPAGGGLGFGVPIGMGGGGGESTGAGADAAAGAGGVDAPLGEESAAVAASDAAVDADRQATVASSGLDSESPEALFGDAAPKDVSPPPSSRAESPSSFPSSQDDSTSFSSADDNASFSSFDDETPQQDRGFDAEENAPSSDSFSDFFGSSKSGSEPADGELFNDTSSGQGSSGDESGSGGLLQTLWDFFTSGDD